MHFKINLRHQVFFPTVYRILIYIMLLFILAIIIKFMIHKNYYFHIHFQFFF